MFFPPSYVWFIIYALLIFLPSYRSQQLKVNNIPFQNHLPNSNESSQNGHPFLHHPHHQLHQQPPPHLPSKSPSVQPAQQLSQPQLAKSFNSSQSSPFSATNLSPYPTYHQLDKEKLNCRDKTLPSGGLYLNGPINLNNKRPKLNTEQNKPMFYSPLMIDPYYDSKRDGSTYVPQVEAISPTNLDEKNGENRITKDEILTSIGKLDREIQQTEDKISKCKKRQKELELTNSPSNGSQTECTDASDLKQLSTTQQVYTENKEKADESQRKFDRIRPLTIAVSLLLI